MKNWSDYFDSYNLVVQKNGDGGDSCNRSFARLLLLYFRSGWTYELLKQCSHITKTLEHPEKPGLYRRHPDPNFWYSYWDRLSRDQSIPLVLALAVFNKPALWNFFKRHLLTRACLFLYNTRRNFQYPTYQEHLQRSTPDVKWNYGRKLPDFTGPEFFSIYIRAFGWWWLRPIMYLGDLETVASALTIRWKTNKTDVINHLLIMKYAKHVRPTWLIWLANKICPESMLKERLDQFFAPDFEPPLNELLF